MKTFLRVHLSTALIMTFAASVLLWSNVRPIYTEFVGWVVYDKLENNNIDPLISTTHYMVLDLSQSRTVAFGWPFKLKSVYIHPPHEQSLNPGTEFPPEETEALLQLCNGPFKGAKSGELGLEEFLKQAPILKDRVKFNWNTASIADEGEWHVRGIFYDAVVALGALAVVAVACEWYVRRR